MRKPYERCVHYYETDPMGIVHHSNYIRWFEEARTAYLEEAGAGYKGMEEAGIISPVVSVACRYRSMVRFGDTVEIYEVTDKETGVLRCEGESSHCFLDCDGRPVSLKKTHPEYHEIFKKELEAEQA